MATRQEWIAQQRRDLLAGLELETLRELEAALVAADDDGDMSWQLAAVNEEIAARVADNLADSIERRRTSDELLDAYREKVGSIN